MIRILMTLGIALLLAGVVGACGGGDSGSSTDEASASNPAAETAPPPAAGSADPAAELPGDDAAPPEPAFAKYETQYDPDAVYSMDDITMEGSYLKIDLRDLTPEQLNRVIHRFRSEFCTCGCPDDPIDQCLVNDPACGTAVNLAKQIIREERIKG